MYNKLFTKILDSSIWLEPTPTRLLWMVFLAAMDEDGMCHFASVANLAHRARLSVEETTEALRILESPDPNSSDPDNEGRRIERVQGGWIVLNSLKYKELVTKAVSRERTRERVARCRARQASCNADVTVGNAEKRKCNDSSSVYVSASLPKEEGMQGEKGTKKVGYEVPPCFSDVDGFSLALAAWIEQRKKQKKPPSGHAIQLVINRLSERPDQAMAALNEMVMRGWLSFKWAWMDDEGVTEKPVKYADFDGPEIPPLSERLKPLMDKMVKGAEELKAKEAGTLL